MAIVDLDKITAIIAEVAAREIMPRFLKLTAKDIIMKGHDDPVTVADRAAEDALMLRLCDILPNSLVVGEESFANDPAILSHFNGDQDVWVIDPIDGTRNFINGIPEFAVMIALVRQKETIAAWIHDPNSGDTLTSEKGAGVFLRHHKMRLAGHDPTLPKLATIGSRLKKVLSSPEALSLLKDLPSMAPGSAAAFDYGRLFTGEATFANNWAPRMSYLLYRQSKAWDHLAGLFMVAETKGYSANLKGNPYDVKTPHDGLFVAPTKELWDEYAFSFKRVLAAGKID